MVTFSYHANQYLYRVPGPKSHYGCTEYTLREKLMKLNLDDDTHFPSFSRYAISEERSRIRVRYEGLRERPIFFLL